MTLSGRIALCVGGAKHPELRPWQSWVYTLGHCYACNFICRVSRIEPSSTAFAGVGASRALPWDLQPLPESRPLLRKRTALMARGHQGWSALRYALAAVASLQSGTLRRGPTLRQGVSHVNT